MIIHKGGFTKLGVLSLVLILVSISFISAIAIDHVQYGISTVSTSKTTTTSYSLGWTFYAVVNYTSDWNITYRGYDNARAYAPTVAGNYTGHGFEIIPIGVNGTISDGLTLCVLAAKGDSSNNSLSASLYLDYPAPNRFHYTDRTSESYGEVGLCISAGP